MEILLSLLIPVPITWIYVIIMCLSIVLGLMTALMLVRSKIYIFLIVAAFGITSIPVTDTLIERMRNVTVPLTVVDKLESTEPYFKLLFHLAPQARLEMYFRIWEVAPVNPYDAVPYQSLSYVIGSEARYEDDTVDDRSAYDKFINAPPMVATIGSMYTDEIYIMPYYESYNSQSVMGALEEQEKIDSVILDRNKNEAYWKAEALSRKTTNQYFNRYLLLASNDHLSKLLQHRATVIQKFENQPIACVGYFLNDPRFSAADMKSDWMATELLLRTQLLESVSRNEIYQSSQLSPDDIIQKLEVAYKNNAYDINNLSIIKTPHNIITLPVFEVPPRAQDCNLLIQLSQALASMEANQASEVFKSILYFTAQRDVFIQEVDSYYNYLLHNKDFPIFSDREVRRDLKEELLKIKENETNIQNAKFRMLELNYRFMIPKYHKSLISASSAAIYNMLQYKFTTMKSLSSNPEDCVRYFLDELIPISKDMADTKWLQEDLAMKNAVMTGPRSELLPANNIDDVNQAIKKQYTVLGYSTEDYDMLTQINTMPPVDACRIATEFSHTISSMEPDKATYIFKNLLYFAEH